MAGDSHEISVVVKADALEPLADVVPEGPVTIVLMNENDDTQDFRLIRVGEQPRGSGLPTGEFASEVIAVEAHGARTVEYELARGRYLLLLDPGTPSEPEALLDLTVQPVDGEPPGDGLESVG